MTRLLFALGVFAGLLCLRSSSAVAEAQSQSDAQSSSDAQSQSDAQAQSDAQSQSEVPPQPEARQQLVVVTSSSWASSIGSLQRYERLKDEPWSPVGGPATANLGRRGMAWGLGLLDVPTDGPKKVEGDGKSPAGVFDLGKAFGHAEDLPAGSHAYPYLHATKNSYCVEDTRSENYNRLVELSPQELTPWRKRSPLARPDGLFEWGVVVQHNYSPTLGGRGSCVFLHVWQESGTGTAGCTSIAKDEILSLVSWLDPKKAPRLVQLPHAAYESLRSEWDLP